MVFPSDKIFIDTENLPLEALGWYLICFVHKINPQFIFPPYPCISFLILSSEFPARLALKSFPDFLSLRIPILTPRGFFHVQAGAFPDGFPFR